MRLLVALGAVALVAACGTVPEGRQAGLGGPPSRTAPAAQPPASAPPVVVQPDTTGRDTIETQPVPPGEPAPPAPPLLTRPAEAAPVKVAMLVPLSGPSAPIGRALLEAAQLALFDLGDDRLALMPRDTQGMPDGARTAAEAALSDGAQLIVGPLFGPEAAAVGTVAGPRGVGVLSFSSDRSVAGSGVFILGFTPDAQVERVVAHARSRGLTRFAALVPETAYGAAVTAALQRTATRLGAVVVQVASYPPDATDLTPVVRRFARYEGRRAALTEQRRQLEGRTDEISLAALQRLQTMETTGDLGFDAVLVAEGGAKLRQIAPLLPYFDVDPKTVRFLGTGLWDDAAIVTEPALAGGWFASTPPDRAEEFRKRFEQAYGRKPPRIASLAYDALALAGMLSRDGDASPFTADRLTNPNGFAGYDGIFRLRTEGIAERGLAVIEVQPKGFRVINPAPTSFETPTQ